MLFIVPFGPFQRGRNVTVETASGTRRVHADIHGFQAPAAGSGWPWSQTRKPPFQFLAIGGKQLDAAARCRRETPAVFSIAADPQFDTPIAGDLDQISEQCIFLGTCRLQIRKLSESSPMPGRIGVAPADGAPVGRLDQRLEVRFHEANVHHTRRSPQSVGDLFEVFAMPVSVVGGRDHDRVVAPLDRCRTRQFTSCSHEVIDCCVAMRDAGLDLLAITGHCVLEYIGNAIHPECRQFIVKRTGELRPEKIAKYFLRFEGNAESAVLSSAEDGAIFSESCTPPFMEPFDEIVGDVGPA